MATTITQTQTPTRTEATTPPPENFPGITPFPNSIPTAPLLRLSLSKLRAGLEQEPERLFSACRNLGFFYLDLRDDSLGEQMLKESDELFGLSEELYQLPPDELNRFDYSEKGSYFGYKGFGKGVVDRKGTLDRNEFYNSPKDDFLGISKEPFAHPQILMDQKDLLKSYMVNAHTLIDLIFMHLNNSLNLEPATLASLHRIQDKSGDHVRMIKAPPQPPTDRGLSLGAHTDFGSITILMNRVGGLQVLLPEAKGDEWTYVRPLPGHCIVNLGDAMVKFTNGLLRSNIHRVVSPPEEQAVETRYSLVYFCRPADEVMLKRLDSSVIPPLEEGVVEEDVTSETWIKDKAMSRRTSGFAKSGMSKSRETGRLAEEDA